MCLPGAWHGHDLSGAIYLQYQTKDKSQLQNVAFEESLADNLSVIAVLFCPLKSDFDSDRTRPGEAGPGRGNTTERQLRRSDSTAMGPAGPELDGRLDLIPALRFVLIRPRAEAGLLLANDSIWVATFHEQLENNKSFAARRRSTL